MGMNASGRRWTSWILLIAFLHALLAPSVASAMGKDAFAQTMRVQLCTMDGPQFIDVAMSDADVASDIALSAHGGFCPLCSYPTTAPDLCAAAFRPIASPQVVPALAPNAPTPPLDTAWRPDRARAPPTAA